MGWTSELKSIVERYCDELESMGITCEGVWLFGSHANGTADEDSDIDLFIASPDWPPYYEREERERLEILGIAAAHILQPVQAIGVTPDERNSGELPLFWKQIFYEQAIEVA